MRVASYFIAAVALSATTVFALGGARGQQAPQTQQGAQAAQTAQAAAPLQLEIAARGYAADERARSMAGDSGTERMDSYVWADKSLCSVGSGNAAPATTPWIGWHFVGVVQSQTAEAGRGSIAFRVEWQRVWENGARIAEGTKGVQSTTLREGERVELDRVTGGGAEGCGVTQVRLEAGVITRAAYRLDRLGLRPFADARLAAAGGRARDAAAPVPARGTAPVVEFKKPEIANQYQEAVDQFRLRQLPGTFDAELWLVHRHPDGTETTELKKVQFSGADLAFTFPAVVVTTAKGAVTLDFSGTLRAGVGPNAMSFSRGYSRNPMIDPLADQASRSFFFFNSADPMTGIAWRPTKQRDASGNAAAADNAVRIAVTIARRAHANSTPPLDLRGGSYFFMNVPAPTDVISFEFPSLPQTTEDLLKGHTFSLRIRVTPVAK